MVSVLELGFDQSPEPAKTVNRIFDAVGEASHVFAQCGHGAFVGEFLGEYS